MNNSSTNIIKILTDNSLYLGNGIIKLDSILNHQVDPLFIKDISHLIVAEFSKPKYENITKIVTAEASGIAPGFCVASELGIPLIYARKNLPITMSDKHASFSVKSRTKGNETLLYVSKEFLNESDNVLIVDDILGSGGALLALINLITQCGAKIVGAACVIEKSFENARAKFQNSEIEIFSVSKAKIQNEKLIYEF